MSRHTKLPMLNTQTVPLLKPKRVKMLWEESRDRRRRKTGNPLRRQRWRIWQRDPHCGNCGRLLAWGSDDWEMDHRQPLWDGGSLDDANCWLLCKDPCHAAKSAEEAAARARHHGTRQAPTPPKTPPTMPGWALQGREPDNKG